MANQSTDQNIVYADLTGGAGTFTSSTTPAINPTNGKTNAFLVSGTFNGATVTLKHKVGSSYVAVGEDTTLTDEGGALFTSPVSDIAVSVASAGSSFDITVVIKPILL